MFFNTLSKADCCACTACEHICPTKSITFTSDDEGFLYPSIDKSTCIDCKLCERVCPVEHPNYNNNSLPETYAALLNDLEERKKSSSGGVFYSLACWILDQGGVVYGATINSDHIVYHIGIEKKEDLHLLRGSKYVQSDLKQVFVEIKNYLLKGRLCLFVGTGCQVAGLKSFLRKPYDTLITADLVCHGVPSQWLFNQHIEYLEHRYKGHVSDYQFRDNEGWGGCESFNLIDNSGKSKVIRNPTYYLSPYLYSFMYGMTSRYSCYYCKFAKVPRQGDITLGDFWGISNVFPDLNRRSGVSLLLLNSEKGKSVFESIKNHLEIRKSTLNDGAKYNENLIRVSTKHIYRDIVYSKIKNEGYQAVAKTEFRYPKYNYIKAISFFRTAPLFRKLWWFLSSVRQKLN